MIEWLVHKGLFRNANHAIWFLCTIGIFLTFVVLHFYPHSTVAWLIVPVIVHMPPLVTATVYRIRKTDSEIYSVDCIWFNAGMVTLYFIVGILQLSRNAG